MTLEDMTLDELLEMLKSGRVGNINHYYMGMFIRYLEELKATRKALEMACDNFNGRNCPVHKRCPEDKDCKDCCVDYFLIKAGNEV